jgi:hypothetical protein
VKVKRQTLYIETQDGGVWLPPHKGWFSGLARKAWFSKLLGMKSYSVSSGHWSALREHNDTKRLVEYEDGDWEIVNENR